MTNTSNIAANNNDTPKTSNLNEAKPGQQQNQGDNKQGTEKPAEQQK